MSDTVSSGAAAASSSEDRNLAFVNYALLFVSPFIIGLTALVAVVIAYTRRQTQDAISRSHYRFQVRIFWVGVIIAAVAVLSFLTGVGILISDAFQSATNSGQGWDAWQVAAIDDSDFHFHPISIVFLIAWLVLWAVAGLWTIIASIVGMARLAGGEGMGRSAAS
jgi:uncharacterized membrane protein